MTLFKYIALLQDLRKRYSGKNYEQRGYVISVLQPVYTWHLNGVKQE